jgi:two-component system CheB/CheR fusion protein
VNPNLTRALRRAAEALVLAVVYFASAKAGLSLATVAPQVTVVWPPTGIALAAVLLLGYRVWPGVALGAFLANATAAEPLLVAAGIAAGNTLEALAGAWLLRRRPGFDTGLWRLTDALALVVLAAVLSTMLSATIGVTSLCLGGLQPWSAYAELWWAWWLGDSLGALVVAPVILTWASERRRPRRWRELGALIGAVAVVSLVVFRAPLPPTVDSGVLAFAIFPLIIWAALRFGRSGASGLTLLVSAVAIEATIAGRGPFGSGPLHERLLLLQSFMAAAAITGLLLGAALSERRRAEAAARQNAARLELALQAGNMGTWEWDLHAGTVVWSPGVEAIHGLPPGSFGGTFEAYAGDIHPEDREAVKGALAATLEQGSELRMEYRIVRPDGGMRWVEGRGRLTRDATGRPRRLTGLCVDITERRQLEAERQRRLDELAEADRRKNEFLAMLAHELRNPLAPIRTAAEILRLKASAEPDLERPAEVIERQVRQLTRLVDELLDVSRISRGKVALRQETVDLGLVVNRAVETVQPLLDARRHRLTLFLPADGIWLAADPARLGQVLANLLENAAKFTPEGGEIDLAVARDDGAAVVRVRDSGIGMEREFLPHAFDFFSQADASLARTTGGLGLGLALARHLIEQHGGSIEAFSSGPGQGSEFVVRLPLASGPTPRLEAATAAAESTDADVAPRRILVVDDSVDAAESLARWLQLYGHSTATANDGRTALDVARSFRPEVVLLDIGLPGMDGYEVARRLRQQPETAPALLVALTGYGHEEHRLRSRQAGFDAHLVKPVDLKAMQELLARPRQAPPSGA